MVWGGGGPPPFFGKAEAERTRTRLDRYSSGFSSSINVYGGRKVPIPYAKMQEEPKMTLKRDTRPLKKNLKRGSIGIPRVFLLALMYMGVERFRSHMRRV